MNTCLPHLPYSEVDAFHLQLNPMQATEYYSKLIKEKAPQKQNFNFKFEFISAKCGSIILKC